MLPKGRKDSCFGKPVGRFWLTVGSCFSGDGLSSALYAVLACMYTEQRLVNRDVRIDWRQHFHLLIQHNFRYRI
jgi:hypothetical protein